MKNTFLIFLSTVSIQLNTSGEYGGEYRVGGYQEPDYAAAQALAEAKAAYRELELQEQIQAAQDAELQQLQQAEAAAKQQQIQARLEELRQDALQKTQDAASAEMSVTNLIENILLNKKLIPIDPWRQIAGAAQYVKSPNSGFVRFDGVIAQTTTNGVLLSGSCGNVETNFFVEDFPCSSYGYAIGESLRDSTNVYVAFQDGNFTYIAIDGSIRSVPKLYYGKPCTRPEGADAIEATARNITPYEEQQINGVRENAKYKNSEAQAADTYLKDFIQELEDEQKAALQAKNAPQNAALKYNREQADRGETYGLLRMGERYRDGEGVPKDLDKAREYLTKAANAGSPTATNELSELNQVSPPNSSITPK